MGMHLIQGIKQSLKIIRWVPRVNVMHHPTYLQVLYIIHSKEFKLLALWSLIGI